MPKTNFRKIATPRWVIENAFSSFFEFSERKHDEGVSNGYVYLAINLSGNSIGDPSLLGYIHQKLRDHNIPPQNISFEITETAAIANLANATHFIKEMRAIGCHFALDDFGSGLSSFAYLKNLPVDYLKIDGSFVKDIVTDPVDHAMVDAINKIGQVMGIRTIAEYVENEDIFYTLRDIGVDFAQGFGIGKPEPIFDEDRYHGQMEL
ncbi:EAL domain-containing protein [Candidatus Reidiella endopervernicosa]|uniref:EAL domain-containing protein n=1 Tax=Candidatus Reidiella endopervernicosa TaxID=2738883 RepID=A0A6N0HT89_9GAMM|nr:EAL domain-containing protein [Candidatus Reidiella endopervernicosa]